MSLKLLTLPPITRPNRHAVALRYGWMQAIPNEPGDVELVEHTYAVEGDYPYTMGVLLLPDALPRWELPEDELLTRVDRALRSRG